MGASTTDCPSDQDLIRVLDNETSAADQSQLEDHLEECSGCQARLEALTAEPAWKKLMPADQQLNIDTNSISGNENTSPAQDNTKQAPPTFPDYTIVRELGRGGMGVVYHAHHHQLNRDVALKVLSDAAARNPERWLRLQKEAEAAARLQHPHIVQVFHSGQHDGIPYVAQELVHNGTLADRIAQTPQSVEFAVQVAIQLSEAIAHAHERDVLHRDIKPSNVLFQGDTVKLADFGLAKLTDDSTDLTESRDVMGTPAYMSPEQAVGAHEQLNAATDIHAIGVLLYEMLCGVVPFRGATAVETIRQVSEHDPVRPRLLVGSIPRDLETICLKCLEKSPDERYASATELCEDLRRFQEGRPILARPPNWFARCWKWSRRKPALAGMIAVSVLALAAILGMWARFTRDLSIQTQIANDRKRDAEISLAEEVESNAATNEVLEFLTNGLFDSAVPENEGIELRVVDVLDDAASTVELRFQDRPKIEAAIRAAIGNCYYHLGKPLKALPQLERSAELYLGFNDENLSNNTFDVRYALALCLMDLDRLKDAKRILSDLQSVAESQSDETQFNLRLTETNVMLKDGQIEEAIPVIEQLHAECVETLGEGHDVTLSVHGQLVITHFRLGQFEAAARVARENYAASQASLGNSHPSTLIAGNNLAIALVRLGQLAESEKIQREMLELKRKSLGEDHFSTIGQKHNLSMVVWRQNRHREATEILAEVIDGRSRVFGATDRRTLESSYQLGRMYLQIEAFDEGLTLFDKHIGPLVEASRGSGQWVSLLTVYAELRLKTGDLSGAQELADRAEELFSNPEFFNASRRKALTKIQDQIEASLGQS